MRRFFFSIIFLFILSNFGASAHGDMVVAVQSIKIRPFQEAMRGFRTAYGSEVRDLDISGMTDAEVRHTIRQLDPELLLAVGTTSLSKIKTIQTVPVVYMMILNPESMLTSEDQISGVSIHVPYDMQVEIFLKIVPEMKRVGIVYHPDRSGFFVKKAEDAAQKAGVELLTEAIYHSKDAPTKIKSLAPKIDVFWMLPDITVITPEVVDFLLVTSFKHKKPILSFSEKYVKMGALAAVTMDPVDIGRQAGDMAKKILDPSGKKGVLRIDAEKAVISINSKTAVEFEIDIDKDIRERARLFN